VGHGSADRRDWLSGLFRPPSIGGIVFIYMVAHRIFSRNAGLWAAIILETTEFYFALGGLLLLDMAVSVLLSAAGASSTR
jgi:4-amino-4-deoxy-L-arabinose transferase-like glycosyltransferase